MYSIPIKQIAEALECSYFGPEDSVVKRVVFDSREVQQGDLFVAIKGQKVDGHQFIDQAIAAGAIAIACEESYRDETKSDIGYISIDDGVVFIQHLGAWCRKQFNGSVIAITGSQGKTSTKDLLAQILQVSHTVVVTKENQNNELGLPLTLTHIDEKTELVVLEMGMTGFGEIDFLCQLANPTHAIITGIGMVHAEQLGSQSGIARAKTELLKYLPENGAIALREADRALIQPYLQECSAHVIWCDVDHKTDVWANQIDMDEAQSKFICHLSGKDLAIHLGFAGKHYISNALLTIAIADALRIPDTDICRGIEHAKVLSSNRMDMIHWSKNRLLINDCYNANPDSMKATIEVLSAYKPRPTLACLGNMFELGQYEIEGHESVGVFLADAKIDLLICYGQLAQLIGKGALAHGMDVKHIMYVDSTSQAAALIETYALEDAVVLLKGSNSMRMYEIADKLKLK